MSRRNVSSPKKAIITSAIRPAGTEPVARAQGGATAAHRPVPGTFHFDSDKVLGPRPAPLHDGSRAGALRLGRYRVVKRLHRGRISHVMLCKTQGIGGVDRSVAVKVLRSRYAQDKRYVDSFLHEERVTSSLHHPNVVQLIDSSDSDYGWFMAMEYIKGWNLQQVIRASASLKQRIPVNVALSMAHGIATGLHYLHEILGNREKHVRVVHRDLQPENVMVSESGYVKLVDFGNVAIEGMEREPPPRLATVNCYTPPEIMSSGQADRRGDIYGLGAILYELTTAHKPQRMDTSGELLPPSALYSDYAPELEDMVLHLLEFDPERRLQSAASIQLALEEFAVKYHFSLSQTPVAQYVKGLMAKQPDKVPLAQGNTQANQGLPAQDTGQRHESAGPGRRGTNMGKTRIRLRAP